MHIIGPDGAALTLADLPAARTQRWVSRRKAEVVTAVNGGLITIQEACERYRLSHEEFSSWVKAYKSKGLAGLRATRVAPPEHRSPVDRPRVADSEVTVKISY
jgi:hypothetical protein